MARLPFSLIFKSPLRLLLFFEPNMITKNQLWYLKFQQHQVFVSATDLNTQRNA